MKKVINKAHRPLKIRLSRGKTLHLGPLKEGQIAAGDVERDSVKKLVESGDLFRVENGATFTGVIDSLFNCLP